MILGGISINMPIYYTLSYNLLTYNFKQWLICFNQLSQGWGSKDTPLQHQWIVNQVKFSSFILCEVLLGCKGSWGTFMNSLIFIIIRIDNPIGGQALELKEARLLLTKGESIFQGITSPSGEESPV